MQITLEGLLGFPAIAYTQRTLLGYPLALSCCKKVHPKNLHLCISMCTKDRWPLNHWPAACLFFIISLSSLMDELRVSCATTDGTLHFLSAHAGDMVWQEKAQVGFFNSITQWSLLDRHFVKSLTLCKLVAGLLVKLEFRGCLR